MATYKDFLDESEKLINKGKVAGKEFMDQNVPKAKEALRQGATKAKKVYKEQVKPTVDKTVRASQKQYSKVKREVPKQAQKIKENLTRNKTVNEAMNKARETAKQAEQGAEKMAKQAKATYQSAADKVKSKFQDIRGGQSYDVKTQKAIPEIRNKYERDVLDRAAKQRQRQPTAKPEMTKQEKLQEKVTKSQGGGKQTPKKTPVRNLLKTVGKGAIKAGKGILSTRGGAVGLGLTPTELAGDDVAGGEATRNFQQTNHSKQVIPVIFEWILYRFPDGFISGKMNDSLE